MPLTIIYITKYNPEFDGASWICCCNYLLILVFQIQNGVRWMIFWTRCQVFVMFLRHIYYFWCAFMVIKSMANVEFHTYLDRFKNFLNFALSGVFSCQLQVCDHNSGCLHPCITIFVPYVSLNNGLYQSCSLISHPRCLCY